MPYCKVRSDLNTSCQDCPNLWVPHEDFCYYFSDNAIDHEIGMTWTEAESYCQGFGGHLTSYATPQERDWVYNSYLSKWPDTHWWIGLNDIKQEGTFEWSDGTTYEDTYVSFWKPQEPSNSGKEDCIEVWVQLPLYKGRWNDNQCDKVNPFVCKKPVGTPVASCPVGWTQNGEKCYKAIDSERNWQEANKDCKLQGSVLVSVTSADQEAFVETLMTPYANFDFWLGYSDTNTPGTLQWANPGVTSTSYDNWAPSQPPTDLPYTGSTCATFANGLSYQWSTGKCSRELKYICERGLSNRCPPGWVLLGQKCYELVINENRLQTWPAAMETCKLAGATLLKIESEEEQTYIGSALVQYKGAGYQEIWLGGSDFARDETFAWADSTPISQFYWDAGMPNTVSGREDCLNLYTGKTTNNWETSSCFHERPFICQLPVGATIPSAPVISVEGKCDDGWRHFNGYCYLIGPSEETQSTASSYCTKNGGNLASILNAAEESFLVGLIQSESWIGLTKSSNSYRWVDNQQVSFQNWASSAPKTNQCVYLRESGTWIDENCNMAKYFICKKTENPADAEKCGDSTWISNPASTQCYFLNAVQLRSWNDARHTCQSIGGDLASINTPEEQAFLFAATTLLPTVSEMWIGGSDWNDWNDLAGLVANGWEWSDGSPFNYLNWNDGEPNNADTENCVELYVSSGRWNDQSCEDYRHFICEKQGTTSSIIGVDVADDDCKSNEACCFKHIGVEKGGVLDDSVLSASTEADENFNAARGRLNTPADVIIINDQIKVGTGHGAWEPTGSDSAPWLQVDLPRYMEIKGIITQGRNGIIQYSERQWTKKYKIGYSQDQRHTGSQVIDWEMLSDDAGNPIIFDGNSDQDTQVTNLFPRPIIARHLRCYPVEWKDRAALRIEYIGCKASCLNKLGMDSGYIKDSMITASSSANGKTPVQARAPVDKTDCLSSTSDDGSNYRGWVAKTVSGITCQRWDSQSPHSHQVTSETNPDADLRNNYCRTPDTGGNSPKGGPWCYTTDIKVEQEICPISICPSYTPTGWSPAQTNDQQYVQVQFEDFYKVSGITLYGSTSTYVSRYALWFSDDGTNFRTYKNQIGQDHLFYGLDGVESEYTDILREPISTKYVRVQPKQWVGGIVMQFEVLGCYVDGRITCADIGSDFSPADGSSSILIDCPSGCVEDTSQGLVYGTDVYTEHSAICPAAVHAGRVTNNHGGTVTVVKTSGQTEYRGSYKNGITSLE
ncbi:unnamed protein product [Clavelina lepadiformis]|uniref:Macrophage mannose receptor 1-like n=1 Tax=Clavelina lepadiformis TaxID=159417 RepID=A0ABP0F4M3_CLALP